MRAPPSGRSSRATPGEHDEPQAHRAHRLRDARGFILVDGIGLRASSRRRTRIGGCTWRRGGGTSPRAPPSTRRCSGTTPPRTPCGGHCSRISALSSAVVRAARAAAPSARAACASPGDVHAGAVRDPHDRQVEAALRGVVVALGHRSRVYARPMRDAGCWCSRASSSRRAAPTRPTVRADSVRRPRAPGRHGRRARRLRARHADRRSSAAPWRRWTRPSATSAGAAWPTRASSTACSAPTSGTASC